VTDLLVTAHTPTLGGGRSLRVYAVVRALAALGGLDVLYVRFGAAEPSAELTAIDGATYTPIQPSRGLGRAIAYGRARAGGVPSGFARGISPELADAAAAAMAAPGRGRLVADGPVVAAALRPLGRRHPLVYLAHNVESAFRHELPGRQWGSRRTLARFERGLLETAQQSWMASRLDIELGHRLAPDADLRYVPNAVDVAAIAPAPARPGAQTAIYVANFAYAPNRRGLRFLLDDVMPRVWERLPDARLMVVGGGLDAPASTDARVVEVGFVDDLAAAYARADCAVVPLLEGGGSPLKFVEALAHGIPVLATPRAARGLDATAGEHYVEAGDAAAFAAALAELLAAGAPELGARGRALAEARYSIEALVAAVAP
jgi:glycosyltransferase involved in cell wall biosynthesis